MNLYDDYCITGDALQRATPEDMAEKERAFEEEWFRRNQKVGYKWSPRRIEALLSWQSWQNAEYRINRRLTRLAALIAVEAVAIIALAVITLR